MTLTEIRDLLVTVDTGIKHYFSMSENRKAYSFWEETQRLSLMADDEHEQGWRFYVHYFTRRENDPKALAFFTALDTDPRTTVRYTVDYEEDTGYIHHIYECEGY